jgi:hypothetical protein
MTEVLACISSRQNVRSWRTASSVRAWPEAGKKTRCHQAICYRSGPLRVGAMRTSYCTHVIDIGSSRHPIGIQFP